MFNWKSLKPAVERFVRVFFATFFVYLGIHLPEIKAGTGHELYDLLIVPALTAAISATFKAWRDIFPDSEVAKVL